MVVMAQLRSASSPGTFILAPNRAPVLSLACSEYHPMVAAAAADGALTLSSAATGFFRRKGVGLFFLRLYEVDWAERSEATPHAGGEGGAEGGVEGGAEGGAGGAEHSGEHGEQHPREVDSGEPMAGVEVPDTSRGVVRICDGFMPDHSTIEATNKRKDANTDDSAVKTAAWDREVGLHRAAWQNGNGIRHAGWLASGGYSGIVRVEEIRGTKLWRVA